MSRKKTPQVQTTTQTNAPPAWAADIFKQASADAQGLYKKGIGGNVYQGERVAGLSDMTKNALNGLQQAAGLYNNPALTQWLNAPTNSATNLAGMAKGNWVGSNSKFNMALQNALNKTSDAINQSMSGAGRYGSGAHTGVLADELGALATNAAAQQYNQDISNMMNANQMIDRSQLDQVNAANAYYQGQSNVQGNALKGGMIQDINRQNILDAERQKWSEKDNQDWNRLERLLQIGTQAAGNYGTTSGKSTTIPSVTKDPLRDAQQVLGLVGGILGLCDVRAKENITLVGKEKGYPLYRFNYKGNPQRYQGVLAQDVLRVKPEAVFVNAKTKLLHVDYDKIGLKMKKIKMEKRPESKNKIMAFFSSVFARLSFLQKECLL
ncbi:tail fiber domain-containing protein [Bartonella krasnovii]|uniref:tail fiber domain-containing protein n=1 Tax=Bartonella krasnovii TaxID=2267275 RepID=UPI001F4C54F9|nr:tail fiber domain-containing protein [Bartonella krasnovii]UNF41851.1 tail fiber domain-containing protein [Bartonella krasnovii]UNF55057.1 tail fiber domain-containing protein [Bartonella krasnovii]